MKSRIAYTEVSEELEVHRLSLWAVYAALELCGTSAGPTWDNSGRRAAVTYLRACLRSDRGGRLI